MSASSSREPFSRGEKWLFASIPLGIAILVAAPFWDARLNAEPRIAFPAPLPLPRPNGYDLYVAAARTIRPATPPVDAVNDPLNLLETNPRLAAKNYSLARKTAWLSANAAGFALFRQATALPCRHPDARSGMVSFTDGGVLRELARSKSIEAHTFILQKRWNDAAHSSLDAVQMGSDMARGGPLTAKLVGSAIMAIGRDPLSSRDLVPEKLSAPQARAAAARLEAIIKRRSTFEAVLGETRWVSLAEFLRISRDSNWRGTGAAPDESAQTTWSDRLEVQLLSKRDVVAAINRSFDAQIRDLQTPWSAAPTSEPPTNALIDQFLPLTSLKRHEAREVVTLHILLLRFGLRAYRLENGAFPASLNQLAPRYLRKIPADIYADGAPFRYRIKNGDYELWSVGPDGRDDNGAPIKWRDDKSGLNKYGRLPSLLFDSQGDYVARRNR